MEKYSEYKDSGVQWLGEIPSHWSTIKSKYIWQEQFATSETGTEDLLSVSQYDGITPAKSDSRSESLQGYKKVEENNLVINIMLAWMGGLGVSAYNGIVSPAYCIYRLTDDSNPKFMHFLYKTPMYLAEFARHSTGVIPSRWRMYTDDFGQVLTIIPPRSEQDAIVSYLDAVTAKIDEAIAQQQKMIDLLNERKQIIINNVVTKGLNPDVKMKDSGVDWIGEIPEGWEVRKLKQIAKTNSGSTPSNIAGKDNPSSSIRWIRTTDLNNDVVIDSSEYLSEKEYQSASCPWLKKDTVLISMYGGAGSFGKLGILGVEATINQALCSIECKKQVLPLFIFYYLQAIHPIWMKFAASSRKDPNLNQDIIKNIQVVIPPLDEQQMVVDMVKGQLAKCDEAFNAIQQQISLLQERKQIIINEVVTGKVKVL